MTSHTVGQQQDSVGQQSSSAETKPAVRRMESSEPIIFDLRVIHFYVGDDDDGPGIQEFEQSDIPDGELRVRRVGEENEDVGIVIDS